ncbi:hypothetical protein JW960_24335 [candidate division KSB1 bacterium]|nr:hypothetical protein [candidate division KSB1 bacterium]
MSTFLIFVSGCSLLISKIALFMYLINSFKLELTQKIFGRDLVMGRYPRDAYKMPLTAAQSVDIKRSIVEIQTLLWTLGIGEVVGYIFMPLSDHPKKVELLLLNAIYLIVASFLCQLLTLLNAWFRIKTNLILRLGFQAALLFLGIILIGISNISQPYDIHNILLMLVLAYFFSSVLALVSMLLDALFIDPGTRPFDFSHYTRLVILLGLIIGSGLFFKFNLTL